jgi:UPF0755 protein
MTRAATSRTTPGQQPPRSRRRTSASKAPRPGRAKAAGRAGRRRFAIPIAVAVGLALAAVALVMIWGVRAPGLEVRTLELELAEDVKARSAGARLAELGLVENATLFELYVSVARPSAVLKSGPHLLELPLSPRDLVRALARLPTRPTESITVPEGWNHVQIAQRLAERGVCGAGAFVSAARDQAALGELGVRAPSADGYLFPATYELHQNEHPRLVVARMARAARRRYTELFQRHRDAVQRYDKEFGWGELELLTLASMLEKEAAAAEERSTIAGVFLNRLTDPAFKPRRMLQSDPTAAYGCVIEPERAPSCEAFDGQVRPRMLRDARNRFNTYQHPGLPPAPIGNPGIASLEAVLTPTRTDYLFFVSAGGGRHTFSRTFDEHTRAVERLRTQRRPR